jgi:hypothetical protein
MVPTNKSFIDQLKVHMDDFYIVQAGDKFTDRRDEIIRTVYKLINQNTEYNNMVRFGSMAPSMKRFNIVAQDRAIACLKQTESAETTHELNTFLKKQGVNPFAKEWYPTANRYPTATSTWTRVNRRSRRRR